MSNRWVISWLVIDYWRWSMSNRWVIEAQKFCGLSITHRWHRLLIDVIDYSSMTHRSLVGYYTAHERLFSCFLVFVCDSFICVRRKFPGIWSNVDDVTKTQSANWQIQMLRNCAIFHLTQLFKNNWTATNQSENETNKYAEGCPILREIYA